MQSAAQMFALFQSTVYVKEAIVKLLHADVYVEHDGSKGYIQRSMLEC
jgi:hypothetical protein